MQIKIYGASDDLIEVEQIGGPFAEEFNPDHGDRPSYLAFSDGTLLSVEYGGMWRIHVLRKGAATASKTEATDEDSDYSDTVILDGDITWVVFGSRYEKWKATL